MRRRGLCWLLVLVCVCTSMVLPVQAKAASDYYGTYTTENLQSICDAYNFKNGYYWSYNTTVSGASTKYTASTHKAKTSTSDKYGKPGETNYKGYSFDGGSECWGFAGFLGYKLSGIKTPNTKWKKYTSETALGDIRVGDIIRHSSHSAVVLTVSDNGKFCVIDANGGSNNEIKYGDRPYFYKGNGYTNAKTLFSKTQAYVLRAPDNVYDYEKKSFSGVTVSGCTIRATCYSTGEVKETVSAGKSLDFVGIATNSKGEVWYKMKNGCFVLSSDVTGTSIVNELFTISATFKNIEKRSSRLTPYVDSEAVSTIKKGATVTVTRFVTNDKGNVWAQLEDGSYLCFCEKGADAKLEFVSATEDITKSDVEHRKYTKSNGTEKNDMKAYSIVVNASTGIYLQGTFESVSPILTITARVRNSKSEILSSPKVVVSPTAKVRTFSMHKNINQRSGNSINITNKMGFLGMNSKNSNGPYQFELAVQYGFEYGGKTYKFGSEQIVDSYGFYVGKNTGATAAPATTAPVTTDPTTSRLPGDVNDDGRVSYADLLRLAKYLSKWKNVVINEANANCNGDSKISYADLLRLAKYLSGWKVTLE